MKEISAKAGCARSTFYLYYADIYALLDAVEEELLEKIRSTLASVPHEEELGHDVVRRMAELYLSCGDRMHRLLAADPAFAPKAKEAILPYLAPWAEGLSGWERTLALDMAYAALERGPASWHEIPASELSKRLRSAVTAIFRSFG